LVEKEKMRGTGDFSNEKKRPKYGAYIGGPCQGARANLPQLRAVIRKAAGALEKISHSMSY
jgi:hypothetical protein